MLHHRAPVQLVHALQAGVHQGGPLESGNLRPQLGRESGDCQTGVAEGLCTDRFGRCGLRNVAPVMTRVTYHRLHRQER